MAKPNTTFKYGPARTFEELLDTTRRLLKCCEDSLKNDEYDYYVLARGTRVLCERHGVNGFGQFWDGESITGPREVMEKHCSEIFNREVDMIEVLHVRDVIERQANSARSLLAQHNK